MATDNNEATAWNGVMSGGNSPAKPDCSKSETINFVLGAAFGSGVGTAITMGVNALERKLSKAKR